MKKKVGFKKIAIVSSILLLCVLVYYVYPAFFPSRKFYIKEFEYNTAIAFPASAVVIKKDASFPDGHGSYTSKAIIELSAQDYQLVYQKLMTDSLFKRETSSDPFLEETIEFFKSKGIPASKIPTILIGSRHGQFIMGFVNDRKTIVFERHSS